MSARIPVAYVEPGMRVRIGGQELAVVAVSPRHYLTHGTGAPKIFAVEVTFEGSERPSIFDPRARFTVL